MIQFNKGDRVKINSDVTLTPIDKAVGFAHGGIYTVQSFMDASMMGSADPRIL